MNKLQPGTYLHKNCFKIVSFIGKGGFGITYLAEEAGYLKATGFGEQYVANKQPGKVVIKELYFDDFCNRNTNTNLVYVTNPSKKQEFEKLVNKQLEEGKILKRLSHKNIVNIVDIFKENDTAYMVMDYIDSVNLEQIVARSGRLSKADALRYMHQILSAAEYIHSHKILHLDITPANILIEKNTDDAILIDFGASLTYHDDNQVSDNTSKLVTGLKRHYAPIEQGNIDNLKEFDATFDTYAVGATLYYLLTGTPPPEAGLVISGRQKITPPSVATGNTDISDYLDSVILKALSRDYSDRYPTAEALSNALNLEYEYCKTLSHASEMMNRKKFAEALTLIKAAESKFGQTKAFTKLHEQCLAELEKGKDEPNIAGGGENTIVVQKDVNKDAPFGQKDPVINHENEKSRQSKKVNTNKVTLRYVLPAAAIVLAIIFLVIYRKGYSGPQNVANNDTTNKAMTALADTANTNSGQSVAPSNSVTDSLAYYSAYVDSLKKLLAFKYKWGYGEDKEPSQIRYMRTAEALGDYYLQHEHNLNVAFTYYKKVTDLTTGTDSDLSDNEDSYNVYKSIFLKVIDVALNNPSPSFTNEYITNELLRNLDLSDTEADKYSLKIFRTTEKSLIANVNTYETDDSMIIVYNPFYSTAKIGADALRLLPKFLQDASINKTTNIYANTRQASERSQQLSWDLANAYIKLAIEKIGISESRIMFSYASDIPGATFKGWPDCYKVVIRRNSDMQNPNTVPAPHPQYRSNN